MSFWTVLLKAMAAKAASGQKDNTMGFQMPKPPDVQSMAAGTTRDPVGFSEQAGQEIGGLIGSYPGVQRAELLRRGGMAGLRKLGGLFGGG